MFKQLLEKLVLRLRYDDITAYAAQISFYLLLSLFSFANSSGYRSDPN